MNRRRWLLSLLLCFTLTAPAWPAATDFDGISSQITVPHQASLDTNDLSFGCWTRRESDGAGSSGIILSTAQPGGLAFQVLGSTYSFFYHATATNGYFTVPISTLNAWTHLVVTSASPNDPTIYFGGVSQPLTTLSTPTGTYEPGQGSLALGNFVASGAFWDGQLAECFWYDRVLTANEVEAIYMRGPNAVRGGRIGYWPLGIYGGRNFTLTSGLTGTESGTSVIRNGPPISYAPQGDVP